MTRNADRTATTGPVRAGLVAVIVGIQAIAAIFFIADAIGDLAAGEMDFHILAESLIAFALLAGVGIGALMARRLLAEAQERDRILAIASGALTEHIQMRFRDWKLTDAEAEVALFAIKGCDAAEIARLRSAAQGTVRAQLSHVYAKSGVATQAELVSLFIDDLLHIDLGKSG
ncbi:MAG: helix-turn-helix transcriptional regulator [Sphingomonadaceae bacterium]|nr:helix-turn-helix transcriptional regulator [Sphingomonadaceae bacterium]